jgi:hypothetical protein
MRGASASATRSVTVSRAGAATAGTAGSSVLGAAGGNASSAPGAVRAAVSSASAVGAAGLRLPDGDEPGASTGRVALRAGLASTLVCVTSIIGASHCRIGCHCARSVSTLAGGMSKIVRPCSRHFT